MTNIVKKYLAKITPSALINFEYPDPTRVLGLSTSHWTDVVNWKVAKEAGIKFAYIKAFNGVNNNIRFWKENYEGAMKEEIKVGAYTWLYPPSVASPGTQARKFAAYMKDFPTQLPNCVDFEWTSPSNPNSGDLYGFVLPFESETGKKPAIYTAPGYWNQFGSTNPIWKNHPLWQAQYRQGRYDIIKPWTGYTFLQWTQTGEGIKYGVPIYGERACELNYYNGTLEQFEAAYGDTPPIDPPTGDTMNYKITCTSKVNIRATGGFPLGADIGDFLPGQVGLGAEILGSPTGIYYCLKVTSGANVIGWVYARWNDSPTYATIEVVTPPTDFTWPDKLVAHHGAETRDYT